MKINIFLHENNSQKYLFCRKKGNVKDSIRGGIITYKEDDFSRDIVFKKI